MYNKPSLDNSLPKWINKGFSLPMAVRSKFAAMATSLLALSSAQAGLLTRNDMTNDPYMFGAYGLMTPENGVYNLDTILLRSLSDVNSPMYETNGSLIFNPNGSITMVLNVDDNWVFNPAFSATFDRYEEVIESPWVYRVYSWNIHVAGLYGWPNSGYKSVELLSNDNGMRFNPIDQIPSAVPEPSSVALTGLWLWLVGAAALRNRRRTEDESTDATKDEGKTPQAA